MPSKIAIIGGGASSLYLALLLTADKRLRVEVFEPNEVLGRKFKATGNGRANLLSTGIAASDFNHPDFVEPLIGKYPLCRLRETLESWGVVLRIENNGYYPLSLHAPSLVEYLETTLLQRENFRHQRKKVTSYWERGDEWYLKADGDIHGPYDYLVIATGGLSLPASGSDGSFLTELKRHGYSVVDPRPGLLPLKVKPLGHGIPNPKLHGVRVKGNIRLTVGEKKWSEDGEVLFRKDDLSGIVMFDAESELAHLGFPKNAVLEIDLVPTIPESELRRFLKERGSLSIEERLMALFPKSLARALEVDAHDSEERLLGLIKRLPFRPIGPSGGFKESQITIGGISLSQLNPDLSSKIENHVHFLGEIVDIDGKCGGFNLAWCLISALSAFEFIENNISA